MFTMTFTDIGTETDFNIQYPILNKSELDQTNSGKAHCGRQPIP